MQNIPHERVAGQSNEFLATQLLMINEVMGQEKKALMNKLKQWLASPPATIQINGKILPRCFAAVQ